MTIGSAGTLVAAGLASAGQYLQSRLLDLLSGGYQNSLMVLLFVMAAVSGLTIVALGGRTRIGFALLIGPFLAYNFLTPRIESTGVAWRFGQTEHAQEDVSATLTGMYTMKTTPSDDPNTYTVRVSWVFALWDRVTSKFVTELISLLQRADIRPDMTFLTRTQKFSDIFHLGNVDPEINKFLQLVFFPNCSAWIDLEMTKGRPDGLLTAEEITRRSMELEERIVVAAGNPTYKIIEDLNARGYFASPPGQIYENYTCQNLWDLSIDALKIQAYKSIAMLAAEETPDGLSTDELFAALVAKFGEDDVSSPDDVYLMLNTISARMLLSAVQDRSRGFARADILNPVERSKARPSIEQRDPYDVIRDIRESSEREADAEQGTIFGMMVAFPYLQGILMALLSLTFPIFVILLVYPPRAHQFLVWMSLWLWVKLWDFGFAVVMLIDEMLWALLPRPPVVSEAALANPGSAFAPLLAGDPTYSIGVYWDLMSMLLVAVPIITGIVVHRSGRSIVSVVGNASTQYARQLRGGFLDVGTKTRQKINPPGANAPSTLLRPIDEASQQRLNERQPSVLAGPPASAPSARPQEATPPRAVEPSPQVQQLLNIPTPTAQQSVNIDPRALLESTESNGEPLRVGYTPGGAMSVR